MQQNLKTLSYQNKYIRKYHGHNNSDTGYFFLNFPWFLSKFKKMKAFLVIQYLRFWFCCISFYQNTFTMEKSTKYVASSSEILV